MPRTIVNLDQNDKDWLDREAKARHVPMTELVRVAIRSYRLQQQSRHRGDFQDLLARTSGLWREGDGLAYQDRLRAEWEPED